MRWRVGRLGTVAGILSVAGGCAWTSADGTRHTVVLGFGIVSCHEEPGISAVDVAAVGAASNGVFTGVGLVRRHEVQIDPNVAGDAVVSVQSAPGSLRVVHRDVEPAGPATDEEGRP